MRLQFRGPTQSRPVQENKPPVSQAAPPPQAGPSLVQRRLTQDGFSPDTRSRQAQSLFGGAPGGGGPVAPNPTVQVAAPPPGQGAPVSPEVQAAVDEINTYQPASQPIGLSSVLKEHDSNSAEDIAFRRELMTALGPDRVAEMMGAVRAMPNDGPALARTLLSAGVESFPVADQGKLVKALGPEMLGAALATGVEAAGSPDTVGREAALAQMQGLARMVGDLSALPAGAPGQAEVAGALDRLKNDEQFCKGPGVSTAAWLVANSGSDALKSSFANGYLEAFKADPTSLSPVEARAVAWALGSMTPSPTDGLGPILDLPEEQRTQFLKKLGAADAPELKATGLHFQEDAQAGVNDFLEDVASLDPAAFPNALAAKELRMETFQEVSLAVDSAFFGDNPGTHSALAHMFAADTADLINASANTGHRIADEGGSAMAKFFDHVLFQGEAGRDVAMEALQQYLGTGDRVGVVDRLAEGQGAQKFMETEGNLLARNVGFVLGTLFQGSQSAMESIDSEAARKKAIVDVMGSLVEKAITSNPVAGPAYSMVKDGLGGQAAVDEVFNWLGKQFGGTPDASTDGVKQLSGSIIEAAWTPFFSDAALQGTDLQRYGAMFGLINMAVAINDGLPGEPNINIGGAFIR